MASGTWASDAGPAGVRADLRPLLETPLVPDSETSETRLVACLKPPESYVSRHANLRDDGLQTEKRMYAIRALLYNHVLVAFRGLCSAELRKHCCRSAGGRLAVAKAQGTSGIAACCLSNRGHYNGMWRYLPGLSGAGCEVCWGLGLLFF